MNERIPAYGEDAGSQRRDDRGHDPGSAQADGTSKETEDRRRDPEREIDEGGRRPDDTAPLVLVDTAAGESRILAQPDASGATPTFGGWVR